ncbi:hypothetical protein SAMN02745196_01216 [Clostridium collagenovorans DSM 3089]|uniref:Uncharacterized protein n=1 Tax=Clostridium collagenovorans DSM 3089 TaxID=1121306 RepID=A0A1M5VBT6_9CLOT|nr:hypothetical protein [Clostridium collagenovorans]SHH72687.1 hypothetical protein SAMN02745196_01216 [Clostridium collagenovorans DSM 3089]
MKKCNKNLTILSVICILMLFSWFSYIKLYTTQVSFNNDPTVAIVKTQNVQWLRNNYEIKDKSLKDNWYSDYGFKLLHADEMGSMLQRIHSLIIILWWITLIPILFMLLSIIYKISKLIF